MASALTRAAQIQPQVATGNAARMALGQGLTDLASAYSTVDAYNPLGLGTTGIASDAVTSTSTEYLDGIRTRAESDFAALPATDDPLPDAQAHQIAFDIASIETASNTVNDVLSTTALDDLAATARELPASLAKGILGGVPVWAWIVAGVIVVGFLFFKMKGSGR
jgi:hypothetical protein